jgi:hypothetical protein
MIETRFVSMADRSMDAWAEGREMAERLRIDSGMKSRCKDI